MYTPPKTETWEKMAGALMGREWGHLDLHDPALWLRVRVYHPRPKSRPKAISKAAWAHGGPIWRPSRPDLDNIIKATMDAIQRSTVIRDDSQFVDIGGLCLYHGVYDDRGPTPDRHASAGVYVTVGVVGMYPAPSSV